MWDNLEATLREQGGLKGLRARSGLMVELYSRYRSPGGAAPMRSAIISAADYRVVFCRNLLDLSSSWPFLITSRRRFFMGFAGTPP